jgi:hypothetical protein
MTWRGSTTIGDRLLACLPYILPLVNVLGFGAYLFATFPVLMVFLIPFFPLLFLYFKIVGSIHYGELVLFFALFLLVVRNYKIKHFIRYNTMQSLLLSIFLSLCAWTLELIGFPLEVIPDGSFNSNLFINIISTTIFLGVFGGIVYSIGQTLRGMYAEIPIVSEAAYMQIR